MPVRGVAQVAFGRAIAPTVQMEGLGWEGSMFYGIWLQIKSILNSLYLAIVLLLGTNVILTL